MSYKAKLSPKMPLWLSLQEAFYRNVMIVKQNWLTYAELLTL